MHDLKKSSLYKFDFEQYRVITCVSRVFHENCFIVIDRNSHQAAIIDPGDSFDLIMEQIQLEKAIPQCIYLTHGHFDHILSADKLSKTFNIPIFLSQKDYKLIRRAPLYAFRFTKQEVRVPEVLFYEETPQLPFGNPSLIPTPGHTQGSVCLNFGDFLFTGDTLFYEHMGPTNYPESNLDDLFTSLDRLFSLPSDATIFSGHGRPWKMKEARHWFQLLDRSQPPQYLIMNDPSIQAKGLKA